MSFDGTNTLRIAYALRIQLSALFSHILLKIIFALCIRSWSSLRLLPLLAIEVYLSQVFMKVRTASIFSLNVTLPLFCHNGPTGLYFLQICHQHDFPTEWITGPFSPFCWQQWAHLASTGLPSPATIPTDALGSVNMLFISHWIWLIPIYWTG